MRVKLLLKETDEDQSNLLNSLRDFENKARPQDNTKKQEKEIVLEMLYKIFEARQRILDGFVSKIFLIKSKGSGILNTDRFKLKKLTPNQILRRLPIALAQVKSGSNLESLLNEIR